MSRASESGGYYLDIETGKWKLIPQITGILAVGFAAPATPAPALLCESCVHETFRNVPARTGRYCGVTLKPVLDAADTAQCEPDHIYQKKGT